MMDLLVSVPLDFRMADQPEATQQATGVIGSEWVQVGQSATEKLYAVTCRTDLTALEQLILDYALPITLRHAQNALQSVVVDADGVPVLDVDGNQQYETVVHIHGNTSDLLAFMPDQVIYDNQGNEVSRLPASIVTAGKFSGHEDWVI